MQEGVFRQNLFYRLNVAPLVFPPVRDRKDDSSLLARYFLEKYSAELKKEVLVWALMCCACLRFIHGLAMSGNWKMS